VTEPRRTPVVLSPEEVARLLEAAPGLKYKAALSAAYGAGLRVSEVANLKVSDIDRERMTVRVEQGKGQRDRTVMLSPREAGGRSRFVTFFTRSSNVSSGSRKLRLDKLQNDVAAGLAGRAQPGELVEHRRRAAIGPLRRRPEVC
jgi:integrase